MKYLKLLIKLYFLLSLPIVFANGLSLRDKIGQMLIIGFDGKAINKQSPIVKAINKSHIGGVILFDYNYQKKAFDKNIESPKQVKQLNQDLQLYNTRANKKYHRPGLPLLISIDYEGGDTATRLAPKYGFPKTISAAKISQLSLDEANELADSMAKTLADSGFNLDYAPDVDVNTNPDNPVIAKKERSFSASPSEVAFYGELFARAFREHGIECAYKHFPGHGSSRNDSHLGFVDVTNTWQFIELVPFYSLAKKPQTCGMIMTAHIVNRQLDTSGLPATLSYAMLTQHLRQKIQYDGVVITDDMQMKAISEHYPLKKALTLAINAGADMILFGNQLVAEPQDPEQVIDMVEAQVKAGKIKKSRINEAYRRIVALKTKLSA